jgi:uncharacterized damage-inducible protein DinB
MVRTQTVIDSWKTVREDTALAVEDFPPTELDFKATADLMTFGELARHILDAGHALTGILLDGVDNLATPEFREMVGKYRPQLPEKLESAALAAELRKSIERRAAELAAKGDDFYSGIITRFDGQKVTRLEMLQFIKEHELTHRSQMFVYLRLKGVVPGTTRRRQAKQKSA